MAFRHANEHRSGRFSWFDAAAYGAAAGVGVVTISLLGLWLLSVTYFGL